MKTLTVEGMSCGHCLSVVTQAIEDVDPEADVRAHLKSGRVEIISDVEQDQFASAIERAGYGVKHEDAPVTP